MNHTTQEGSLPLFEQYPALLERVPHVSIGTWPTPVAQVEQFAKAQGLGSLHLKREDLSHAECAGNKIRGLEFLIADARQRKSRTLITFSAAGSHHVCRTAWHARRHGIATTAVVVDQPREDYVGRNLRAGASAGAKYISSNYATVIPKLAWHLLRTPHGQYVAAGGTSPLTCLGHANAGIELARQIQDGQLPEPDYLYGALGSLGTMAGLLVGCRIAGLKTRLVGITVSYRWYCTPRRWARLAARTHRLMQRLDPSVPSMTFDARDLIVIHSALGNGYGHFTQAGTALTEAMRDLEGIHLDGTYTAKALSGAIQFMETNRVRNAQHLFWHTYHPLPEDSAEDGATLPAALQRYLS